MDAVLQWLGSKKKADLTMLLGEWCNGQRGLDGVEKPPELHISPGYSLFMHHPQGKDEDLLLFVVPKAHQTATLNGCHWDAGHQDTTKPSPYYRNISGGWEWPNK